MCVRCNFRHSCGHLQNEYITYPCSFAYDTGTDPNRWICLNAEEGIAYPTERICFPCSSASNSVEPRDNSHSQNIMPSQEVQNEPVQDVHNSGIEWKKTAPGKQRVSNMFCHKLKAAVGKCWNKISGKAPHQHTNADKESVLSVPRIEMAEPRIEVTHDVTTGTLMQMVEELLAQAADARNGTQSVRTGSVGRYSLSLADEDQSVDDDRLVEDDSSTTPLNPKGKRKTPSDDLSEYSEFFVKRETVVSRGCIARKKPNLISEGTRSRSLHAERCLAPLKSEGKTPADNTKGQGGRTPEEERSPRQTHRDTEGALGEDIEEHGYPVMGEDFPSRVRYGKGRGAEFVDSELSRLFLDEEYLAPVKKIEKGKAIMVDLSDDERPTDYGVSGRSQSVSPRSTFRENKNRAATHHTRDDIYQSWAENLPESSSGARRESFASIHYEERPFYWKRYKNLSADEIESIRPKTEETNNSDDSAHFGEAPYVETPATTKDSAERKDSVDPECQTPGKLAHDAEPTPFNGRPLLADSLEPMTSPLERMVSSVYSTGGDGKR